MLPKRFGASRQYVFALLLVPSVAMADPVSVRDLAEVRDLASLSVAPDGRTLVFQLQSPETAADRVQLDWYALRPGAAKPVHLADAGEPIRDPSRGLIAAGAPSWNTSGSAIYYRALRDGQVQVWSVDLTGRKRQVTHDEADVRGFTIRGDTLTYQAGPTRAEIVAAEQQEDRDGVLVDARVNTLMGLTGNARIYGRLGTLRLLAGTGQIATLLGDRPERSVAVALRGATLAKPQIPKRPADRPWEETIPAGAKQLRPGAGATAYLAPVAPQKEVEGQKSTIYQLAVAAKGGAVTWCRHEFCQGVETWFRGTVWREEKGELIVATEEAGRSVLRAWSPATDAVREILFTDGSVTGADRWNLTACPIFAGELVCIAAAPTSPPALVGISLDTGRQRTLFDPNATLRRKDYGEAARYFWSDREGRKFDGILIKPLGYESGRRYPLVITTYRCRGYLRGGTGDDVPEHVLSAFGFVVLCANHSAQYLHAADTHGNEIPAYGQIVATSAYEAAIDALSGAGMIDAQKVGLSGLSFGAQATLFAISHSRRFAAATVRNPTALDPDYFRIVGPAADGPHLARIMKAFGLPWPDRDADGVFARISPAERAAVIDTPLLLQLSDHEFRAALQLQTNLVREHKPVEVFAFPNVGHMTQRPIHQLRIYERNVDWFRFWLQGAEDAVPEKSAQYARWLTLRRLASAHENAAGDEYGR